LIPWIPGHFTRYEWMALALWAVLGGLTAASRNRRSVAEKLPESLAADERG
jgi:hypothetical protein